MLWSKTTPTRKSYSHDSGSHSKITPAPRKWGCGMLKNWCPYPDLSFQLILMTLVSKFLYSCLVSRTIIKMEKMDEKGQKWPKFRFFGHFWPFWSIICNMFIIITETRQEYKHFDTKIIKIGWKLRSG